MRKTLAALLFVIAAPILSGAVVTISDTLLDARGTPINGSITISWRQAFTEAGGAFIGAGEVQVPVINGAFTVTLYPNTTSTVAGVTNTTFYTAKYVIPRYFRADEIWIVPSAGPYTIGQVLASMPPVSPTIPLLFSPSQINGTGASLGWYLTWNGTETAWHAFTGGIDDPGANGLVTRTALNTTTARSIAGTLPITVTNGNGVSGNPTIACPTCPTTANPLSQFAATTSAQLAATISDETGSGAAVFGTSPTITTPIGIVKADVGLGSVDNTADSAKNVATAVALASNPANCSAGNVPRGVDANGAAEGCAPVNLATETTGAAPTATALAADPANCGAGNLPRGVDASGVAQGCAPVNLATETTGAAPTATALAADPANCSSGALPRGVDASGVAQGCAAVNLATETTGPAPTATALASAPTVCTAGNFPVGVDASGNASTCTRAPHQFFGTAAPGSVSGNLPGDLFSDTTNSNAYWCSAVSGTAAPACTSVTLGGWALLSASGDAGYSQTFTGQTSVALAHNFGTTKVETQCFDASTPPNAIEWNTLSLTDANTVTVTFTASQSGKCVVLKGSGGAGSSAGAVNAVSFSATPAFNLSLGWLQTITLTANVTSSTVSSPTSGITYAFKICQDSTGSWTFVWPTTFHGAMTIGPTLSLCSVQAFIYDGSAYFATSVGVINQ